MESAGTADPECNLCIVFRPHWHCQHLMANKCTFDKHNLVDTQMKGYQKLQHLTTPTILILWWLIINFYECSTFDLPALPINSWS